MHRRAWLFIVVFLTAAAGSSCFSSFDLSKPSREEISSPSRWRISSRNKDFTNLEKALDTDTDTVALSGSNYKGASFTLDLGQVCPFNMVVLFHGGEEFGFARKVCLSISIDGKNFRDVHVAPGTRGLTYLMLMTPVNARYLRFAAVEQGSRPWAIGGIFLQ